LFETATAESAQIELAQLASIEEWLAVDIRFSATVALSTAVVFWDLSAVPVQRMAERAPLAGVSLLSLIALGWHLAHLDLAASRKHGFQGSYLFSRLFQIFLHNGHAVMHLSPVRVDRLPTCLALYLFHAALFVTMKFLVFAKNT